MPYFAAIVGARRARSLPWRTVLALFVAAGLGAGCAAGDDAAAPPAEAAPQAATTPEQASDAPAATGPSAVAPPTPAGLVLRGTFLADTPEAAAPVRTGISWDGERLEWLANGQSMRQDTCRIVDESTQDVTLSCLEQDGTTTTHRWVLLDADRVVHAVTPGVVLQRAPVSTEPPAAAE